VSTSTLPWKTVTRCSTGSAVFAACTFCFSVATVSDGSHSTWNALPCSVLQVTFICASGEGQAKVILQPSKAEAAQEKTKTSKEIQLQVCLGICV